MVLESDRPGFEKKVKYKVKACTFPHTLTSKFLVFFQKRVCVCVFIYVLFIVESTAICLAFYLLLSLLATWKSHLVPFHGCLVFSDVVCITE